MTKGHHCKCFGTRIAWRQAHCLQLEPASNCGITNDPRKALEIDSQDPFEFQYGRSKPNSPKSQTTALYCFGATSSMRTLASKGHLRIMHDTDNLKEARRK